MKKYTIQLILIMLFLSVAVQHISSVNYTIPSGFPESKNYRVTINQQQVFVYDTRVFFELNTPDRIVSFVQFNITGKAKIEISPNKKIESVRIRPSNLNIPYILKDGKIYITLKEPRKISVEINGNIDDNIFIFANQPEVNIPSSKSPNVLYYGPGVHTINGGYGILELKSNQTLYLAEGAILKARIYAENASNIKIKGRGIIDGSTLLGRQPDYYGTYLGEPDSTKRPFFVHFKNCKNIELEGIVLNDAPHWMLVFSSCTDVRVDNIKEFGFVDNTDGIDVVGSKNVTINDVFIRNNDDCVVLKGKPDNVENIRVTNSIVWSDRANALQIGHETLMSSIKNVVFSNIDVLEQRNRYIGHAAIGIFNGDSAVISDVRFENIRVENCERLLSLAIEKGYYNKSPKRGKIENIYFKDIYSNKTVDIHIDGYDTEYAVRNIVFENLYLNSKPAQPELFLNPYVYNLKFIQNNELVNAISSTIQSGTTYIPIDISEYCNRSLCDETLGDGKGWLDLGKSKDMETLKGQKLNLTGIPFHISDNHDKGAIILRSSQYLLQQPYASYPIKIAQKADYMFFMHTTAFTNKFVEKIAPEVSIGDAGKLFFNQSPTGTCLWYYVVRYKADGMEVSVPVKAGMNVEDGGTWSPGGWVVPLNGQKFYIQKWDNPFPDKDIESVKMYSSLRPEVPILMAITLGKK